MRQLAFLLVTLGLVVSAEAQERGKAGKANRLAENISVETDIEYAKAGDYSLKLDVYRPKRPADGPRPCVVWIHGGGWQGGNKSSGAGRLVGPFVSTGEYVGVSVGYRLTDVARWPAQIHDCKAAIRYLRANAEKLGINPEKIGVWGGSAGGHLVSLLGTSGDVKEVEGNLGTTGVSSRVACVVDFCGPSDFPNFQFTSTATAGADRGGAQGPISKLLGGMPKDRPEVAKEASPITYVSKDDPPFLIVHGSDDKTVPYDQAVRFHEAQNKAGMNTTFVTMQGGGHGIGGEEIITRVKAFFDKHLLDKPITISSEPIQVAAAK